MAKPGTLYLIPIPIAESALDTIAPETIRIIHSLDHFAVENARTARRFISATNPPYRLPDVVVHEIPKHDRTDPSSLLTGILDGINYGVMSEAGCPGIADPGSELVAWAHANNIKVKPLVGPSSLLMALMASGMNGQSFTFHGYLPRDKKDLANKLTQLEREASRHGTSQIFIEAPYRNGQVVEVVLKSLKPTTRFTIAVEVTSSNEYIRTLTVEGWRNESLPELHKRPAVFVIG
jgi:16S rRNA (cytidine1402-2'-O)-methyltransferase